MSDIQNQNPEEIVETPTVEGAPDAAPTAVSLETETSSSEKTSRPSQNGRT